MPPKKRTKPENRTLPQRWEWHQGKIHYQIPPALAGHVAFGGNKRRFLLGATMSEAHRKWSEIQEYFDGSRKSDLIPDVVQEYQRMHLEDLSPKTRNDYISSLGRLAAAFQEFTIHNIEPSHCYSYVDANMSHVRQARLDIRVLSSLMSWCVQKGWIKANPLIGQLKFTGKKYNPARSVHYVSDADLDVFMSVIPRKWQLYVMLKLKTGQSKQTLLTTRLSHIGPEGIDFNRSKTGVDIPFFWDDELRAIVDEIRGLYGKVGGLYLFCNRHGQPYYDMAKRSSSGFDTIWKYWQRIAVAAGMTSNFTEHQLRHKATSDNDLAHASEALGHSDTKITRGVYQVKRDRVAPLSAKIYPKRKDIPQS